MSAPIRVRWTIADGFSLMHLALDGPHPAYFRLIKLWKVADAIQTPALKNTIIDTLCTIADATNSVPTPDDTHALFGPDVGEEMTKLCDLTLDLFVWKKTGHLISTHPDSWDEQFLRLLVVRLKERGDAGGRMGPWTDVGERCRRYHIHDQWAPVEYCAGGGGVKRSRESDGWVQIESGREGKDG